MSLLPGILVFLVALGGMEAVAFLTHRYIMHGPMWRWHRSHHEPRTGWFELNDLFAVVFAGVAIGLFLLGTRPGLGLFTWAAAGVTAYGGLYALVHDGLVHRRFPMVKARRGYLLRLVQAHHLHHLAHEKVGAVSFGFLLPQDPEKLARRLADLRRNGHSGAARVSPPPTSGS